MDYRETISRNVASKLSSSFDSEQVNKIMATVILELSRYNIMPRTDEIAIRDDTTSKILKLYSGTLLTEGKSKRTVDAYLRLLNRFAQAIHKPLTDVNVFDIRVWLATMQQQVSLRSCENYRSYLASFYTWLTNEEIIAKNPMAKISPIKFEDEVRLPFSDVEIDALRGACETLRDRAVLEVLLSCGARAGELCSLDRGDIDTVSKDVVIRHAKGGKQRRTYINDVARVHLQKYLDSRADNDPCMFMTRNKTRLTKAILERDLKRIGRRAGVTNVHPHRCRRTFASTMARKGMDVRTIQILMGHSDLNTTMGYITLDNQHVVTEYRKYA